jgi:CheY-like chemotaxis protein
VTPKLLLADDSVTIQRVIELTFADENVQVVAVGDGKQAIDRVQADRPDIVLADVGMPERDGYEVAAFIKGNPQLAHIPVLLLTGAFEPIDEARARSVGCDGVLVKPFEPQMVISRVRELLTGAKPVQKPAPAAPPPAAAAAPAAPIAPPDGKTDSLEEYFDRLDAALATIGPGTAAPSSPVLEPAAAAPIAAAPQTAAPQPVAPIAGPAPASGASDPLGGWDPDLTGTPSRVAPVQPAAAGHVPPAPPKPAPVVHELAAPVVAPVVREEPKIAAPAPGPEAPASVPSLTDAFAALLAAEQGHPAPALPAVAAPAAPALTEQTIEEIVGRVIARMGDDSMRRAVLDAAERLVREEIDRIKQATQSPR